MTDDFKRKLEAYEKGELSESEMEEMEIELAKLETYYEFIDHQESNQSSDMMNEKKQIKILKRGKWKARFQTSFTVFCIFILITIASMFLTAIYYSWGKPDRVDVYRNIIDYTLTVTDPYGYLGSTSTNAKPFFILEATRDLKKRIGDEVIGVGEMEVNYFFSLMGYPIEEYYGRTSQEQPSFIFPGEGEDRIGDWNQLDKLPEGTVVSAYVSFSELLSSEEVFKLFKMKNMDIIWFAVHTGSEDDSIYEIGFPNTPIWHDDDMILESREEEKGIFGSSVISELHSSPSYEEGDYEMLHTQLLKTLTFLSEYEKKVDKLFFDKLELNDRLNYLKENGIENYGVVITGPTKEVLKLQDEEWISNLEVDEVAYWNWEWDRSEEE
ncbi:anti-sigma factor [Ornithinibacillus scapharcae]|uniref:anti-sigma factor n=1 Tax=Ornithinibacillus scapharcae TaxID=1147159 RepID=UPI000225B69C|nr:anti-sigma factor [Ornithinibacillus scapharcae]